MFFKRVKRYNSSNAGIKTNRIETLDVAQAVVAEQRMCKALDSIPTTKSNNLQSTVCLLEKIMLNGCSCFLSAHCVPGFLITKFRVF